MFSGYPQIAEHIYMFNIDVVQGNPTKSVSDDRIGLTVLQVFQLFFQSTENAVVYVCDTLDDRHLARKRKFDSWFWRYNNGSLIKEDDTAIVEGVEIYSALIIHKSNQHLKEIILAYKELNEKAEGK
jgi:hypothetical protein